MAKMFRGRPACACLIAWLPVYEAELLRRGVIKHSLDIYQLIGGAKASGGTHSKGGAFDIGQTSDVAIEVARQMGADATWHRPYNWDGKKGMEHTHGVLRGCPHNGPARYQITAVDAGYNGLGHLGMGADSKGRPNPRYKDTGPRPLSKRTWWQGIAWARAQRPDELVVAEWNVLESNDPANVVAGVKEIDAEHKPDVFVLLEAVNCHPELEQVARELGLVLLQEKPTPRLRGNVLHEQGDTAILVRAGADVTVIRSAVAVMRESWVGPKHHLRHEPRRYRPTKLRVRGRVWRIAGAHFETQGPDGPNGKAFRASMAWAQRWLLLGALRPSIVLGDINTHRGVLGPWAKRFHALVAGIDVDLALCLWCTAEVTELDAHGSDHKAVLFRFTATRQTSKETKR